MHSIGEIIYSQGLAPSNTWMSSPGATQYNVVLGIKEVRSVRRVQRHRLEPLVLHQLRAGPLPHAAQLTLPSQLVATRSHGDWMPMPEPDIRALKVGEKLVGASAVHRTAQWRSLLDSVVG